MPCWCVLERQEYFPTQYWRGEWQRVKEQNSILIAEAAHTTATYSEGSYDLSGAQQHLVNVNLYLPQANLTIYQRGVNYAGVKIFNKLPIEIRNTSNNINKFKAMLKHFLITHSFNTVEEYLNVTHLCMPYDY
jgi:hypothetical protein